MSQNHLPNMPEKMVLITSQHNHWLQSTDLNFIKGLLLCSFSVIFWLKCMYTPIYNIKIKMNKWIFIILWVTNQLNIPACGSTSSTMLTDSWVTIYVYCRCVSGPLKLGLVTCRTGSLLLTVTGRLWADRMTSPKARTQLGIREPVVLIWG